MFVLIRIGIDLWYLVLFIMRNRYWIVCGELVMLFICNLYDMILWYGNLVLLVYLSVNKYLIGCSGILWRYVL